jgi:hypothetical protein
MMMQQVQRPTPFAVLFLARCGSTYLIEALRAQGETEVLFEQFQEEEPQRQLPAIRDYLTRPCPKRAVGFKNKLDDIDNPKGLAEVLREIDARVICLTRRNHIKHVVSLHNAYRLHNSTGDWNLYSEKNRLPRFRIDPMAFDESLHQFDRERTRLINYAARLECPTLLIQYEHLQVAHDATLNMVFGFLGLSTSAVRGDSLKNTSDDLRDVLENFDELRDRYAGTPYEPMFDEVLVPSMSPSDPVGPRRHVMADQA